MGIVHRAGSPHVRARCVRWQGLLSAIPTVCPGQSLRMQRGERSLSEGLKQPELWAPCHAAGALGKLIFSYRDEYLVCEHLSWYLRAFGACGLPGKWSVGGPGTHLPRSSSGTKPCLTRPSLVTARKSGAISAFFCSLILPQGQGGIVTQWGKPLCRHWGRL